MPEREVDARVLQLHEKQIIHYNTIRAENFIEQLQELWETSTNSAVKLDEEIQQDWLNFAIQMCNDKLPPKLPNVSNKKLINFSPENSISYALYQVYFEKFTFLINYLLILIILIKEYKLYNENIDLVKNHIKNLEKYLLLNTQLFPHEWKDIALSLQLQRVPDEWEAFSCRPSIHTLKSWLKCKN